MAGILEPEDDDLQVVVHKGSLDLGAEKFRGAKEEIALHVHDRDGRIGALPFLTKFPQVSVIIDCVFDEIRAGGLAEKQRDGQSHSDKDGGVQGSEKR